MKKISLYNPYAFSYASMLSQKQNRPKVGLVLSGGGAKVLHI
jgi:hypothetical protein